MLQDVGSADVTLAARNGLTAAGGLARGKAYNVHKEVLPSSSGLPSPFEVPRFEALAYTQELIDRWYTYNSIYSVDTERVAGEQRSQIP
jgi:hypothetical protein